MTDREIVYRFATLRYQVVRIDHLVRQRNLREPMFDRRRKSA